MCFSLLSSQNVFGTTLILASDVWCPYVCDQAPESPGFIVEVAQQVFAQQGYQVKYQNLNWARAIQEARVGHIHGILGAFRGDAPDFIFPEQPIAAVSSYFFTLKDNPWRYSGLESLAQIKIGAIVDYDYGDQALNRYLQRYKFTYRVNLLSGNNLPLARGIQMMLNKRLDAFIETPPVFWYTSKAMGLAHHFKAAGPVHDQENIYIAFSPAHPLSEKYAQILNQGITRLKQSGEFQRLQQKYQLVL